jgi:hypothetical protein
MIRLSIGLEAIDDILWDIDQALDRRFADAAILTSWPWLGLALTLVLLARKPCSSGSVPIHRFRCRSTGVRDDDRRDVAR